MGVFVKICGVARAGDAERVAEMRPDAMGFIFWPGSPRAVTPGDVRAWTRRVPPGIRRVGVFVDADAESIRRAVDTAGLDVVQLHGREGVDIAESIPVEVWKVVHLEKPPDTKPYAGRVDAYLIDGYSTKAPGGTGTVADWSRARAFVDDSPIPVLLAGGLTARNVREGIATVRPWGVDVSSGVERSPGQKDLSKVEAFITACRKNS